MNKRHRTGEVCQYCDTETKAIHMKYGDVVQCPSCNAYVSIDVETNKAKGCVANTELRLHRRSLHVVFDKLVQRKMTKDKVSILEARKALYGYIEEQMGFDFYFESIAQLNKEENIIVQKQLKKI